MQKTLRITSLAVSALACCGVCLIIFLTACENLDILAYLNRPGITTKFMNVDVGPKNLDSPLVFQAQQFARRINPPPPPPPPVTVVRESDPPNEIEVKNPPPPPPPPPPKFVLLATVMCRDNPSRSMVLLRQSGNKDEWFWQGERVGNVDVTEVRNGSAVLTQDGHHPEEYYVPEKPNKKSLLRAEGTAMQSPVGPVNRLF